MTENITTLTFLRNQNWKKAHVETEKLNKSKPNIPTDNTTELNEVIMQERN